MRDNIKDKSYFDIYIDKRIEAITFQQSKIDNKSIDTSKINIVKKVLFESYLKLICAMYSRGDDMNSPKVLDYYHSMVSYMKESRIENRNHIIKYVKNGEIIHLKQYTFSGYLDILNILSLGILLNVSLNDLKIVSSIIRIDEVKDYLLNFLSKSTHNDIKVISGESYHDENYMHINQRLGVLKGIIFEENNAINEGNLKFFLNKKWYNSLKGTGYYNQHLNRFGTYTGYWCFAAAAIVKIKGLDDSSFRDNQYYPKDLLKNQQG